METTDILERGRSWPLSIPQQRLAELIDCKLAMARLSINRAVAIWVLGFVAAPSCLPAIWTGTTTSSCCRSFSVVGYILSLTSTAISR
jgi:hypothetical protein